ncbi:MAG TPA: hypothetical protein VGK22_14020 [Candidatus Angelobacter sp.]
MAEPIVFKKTFSFQPRPCPPDHRRAAAGKIYAIGDQIRILVDRIDPSPAQDPVRDLLAEKLKHQDRKHKEKTG